MATTVEVLSEAFDEMGTPFIVGHPGGETVELMEGAQSPSPLHLDETGNRGGHAGIDLGRDNRLARCLCVDPRAGAANMVNGVAHAWMDRAPLIAINDQYPGATLETGMRQVMNQHALFAPITKWQTTIHAKSVRQQIRRAIRVTTSPTPGPVQFDMPSNETMSEAGETVAEAPLLPNIVPIEPDRNALKVPLQALSTARKPILLAGLGVFWDKASAELVALAERLARRF